MHRRTAIAAFFARAPRGAVIAAMISIHSATTTGTGTGITSGAGCGSETG